MFKALEVIDLADQKQVQLRITRGEESQTAAPVAFGNPLGQSLYEEMAWYFKDYLEDPFGTPGPGAREVETSLRNLGRLMFEAVFRGNQEAQSYYSTAVAEGLADYQLTIVSPKSLIFGIALGTLERAGFGLLGRPPLVGWCGR